MANTGFYKLIPITGAVGAGAGYQVQITVYAGIGVDSPGVVYLNNKSINFPRDISFYDADLVTVLPYELVYVGYVSFIVKVEANLDAATNIAIFYGTPGLLITQSDPVNVHDVFEDFCKLTAVSNNPTTFEDLEALLGKKNHIRNKISKFHLLTSDGINYNTADMIVLNDPLDTNKLLCFFTAASVLYGGSIWVSSTTVARFTVDPTDWDTPIEIFWPSTIAADWDSGYARLCCVVYNDLTTNFHVYYQGFKAGADSRIMSIGVALFPSTNRWTFSREASNPILAPDMVNEFTNQSISVIKDGANWYGVYGMDASLKSQLDYYKSITSTNGIALTRTGTIVGSRGSHIYNTLHIEKTQLFKIGAKFVLLFECADSQALYTVCMASTDVFSSANWVHSLENPIWGRSYVYGTFDFGNQGTPSLHNINGRWYMFYQGHPDVGGSTWRWDAGVSMLQSPSDDYAHGQLAGRNGWTGDVNYLVQSYPARSANHCLSLTGASFNPAKTIQKTFILPSWAVKFSVSMRFNSATGLDIYPCLLYIFEGANYIAAIGIGNDRLIHLIPGAWEPFGPAIAPSVWYDFEISFPTKSTHKIWLNINGVMVEQTLTTVNNYGAIVNKPDRIVLERFAVVNNSGDSYFDRIMVDKYVFPSPIIGTAGVEQIVIGSSSLGRSQIGGKSEVFGG